MLKKMIVAAMILVIGLAVSVAAEEKGKATNAKTGKTTKYKTNKRYIEYEFVKGKGVEICEAYYKNLLDNPADDIRCERDFNPELKDFKKTNWEKLNLVENKEIVRKIRKFITYGDQFEPDKEVYDEKLFMAGLKEDEEFFGHAMYFAKLDINNDGKLDNVMLYNEGFCMYTKTFQKPLLIITEDKSRIDIEKTDLLLQSIPDPLPSPSSINYEDIKIKATNNMGEIYDAFTYKNTIYFDKWNTDYSRLYDVTVYSISNNKAKKICKYKCVNRCWN